MSKLLTCVVKWSPFPCISLYIDYIIHHYYAFLIPLVFYCANTDFITLTFTCFEKKLKM